MIFPHCDRIRTVLPDKTNDNSNIEANNSVAVIKSVQANKMTTYGQPFWLTELVFLDHLPP